MSTRSQSMMIVISIVLFAVAAHAGVQRMVPVDQAVDDRELAIARQAVIEALDRRDIPSLLEHLSHDLLFSNDLSSSVDSDQRGQLLQQLKNQVSSEPMLPADPIWIAIREALRLGGTFTTTRGSVRGDRQFCAPYVFSAYPDEKHLERDVSREDDPLAVIQRSADVRARPELLAPVIDHLDYLLIYVNPSGPFHDDTGETWYELERGSGHREYVLASALRRSDDYHVCFGMRDGSWKITAIAEGVPPGE